MSLKDLMNFSARTNWNLTEHDFATAVQTRRAAGHDLLDLTVSNPTSCGLSYDDATLLAPLSAPSASRYEPDPLGMKSAREAVSSYYRDAGALVSPDRICLTTSTSEAYSFLFRLLCDPGDEVLVAQPSYPLFDYIAQLDNVQLRHYPLFYDPNAHASSPHGWSIDLHTLSAAFTERTRALIVVHPNNPTGNFASRSERDELERLCTEHNVALLADEVFLDYPTKSPEPSFATGDPRCLTFVLSGISKVCGLPQMKASWIAACGPKATVLRAMERLEVIADTFLSMSAPTQAALPEWLAKRKDLQHQIRDRMKANLEALDHRLQGTSGQRLAMQGGWTVVLRVPKTVHERAFALAALDHGVLVQPGDFYSLGDARIVLSLLTPPDVWIAGLNLLPLDD
jgi:alanine-synthesizing transaminase